MPDDERNRAGAEGPLLMERAQGPLGPVRPRQSSSGGREESQVPHRLTGIDQAVTAETQTWCRETESEWGDVLGLPASVLDFGTAQEGTQVDQAVADVLATARHADHLGFRRFWGPGITARNGSATTG